MTKLILLTVFSQKRAKNKALKFKAAAKIVNPSKANRTYALIRAALNFCKKKIKTKRQAEMRSISEKSAKRKDANRSFKYAMELAKTLPLANKVVYVMMLSPNLITLL